MDNEKLARVRGANYTREEKTLLLNLIKNHEDVVQQKGLNAEMLKRKREAWKNISQQFNERTTNVQRSTDSLRKLYKNIKAERRRANIRRQKEQVQKQLRFSKHTPEAIIKEEPCFGASFNAGELFRVQRQACKFNL